MSTKLEYRSFFKITQTELQIINSFSIEMKEHNILDNNYKTTFQLISAVKRTMNV